MERNATWQMLQAPPPAAAATTAPSTTSITATVMDPTKLIVKNHCDLSFFNISPHTHDHENGGGGEILREDVHYNNRVESQTLQLFPLRSGSSGDGCCNNNNNIINSQKETDVSSVSAMDSKYLTPSHQFFEFLPLKN